MLCAITMSSRGPFSVLLCDDSMPMRTALRTLMQADGRFHVVGEASDGVEAVEQAKELRPNVVLLDVTMPRVSGIEALPDVVQESPHSTVILLTAFSREKIEESTAMHLDSLRGVYYMDKTRDGQEILDSIAALANASLSTSLSPVAAARSDGRPRITREWVRGLIDSMSRNRRAVLAGFAVLALSSLAAFVAVNAQSAAGSCVHAQTPSLSGATLYGGATQSCSDAKTMYAFIQGRRGKASQVYTLAQGSTGPLGKSITIGTAKCPLSGTWRMWTLATRALKTSTSPVITYSCAAGTSGKSPGG
jgi:DNA-binding NarL/FixJ family response regulator